MKGKIKKMLLVPVLIFILYVVLTLAYGTIRDFRPKGTDSIELAHASNQSVITDSVLTFVSWNIGYGGLGAKSDFFFDSGHLLLAKGKMIRPSKELVEEYLAGIAAFTENQSSDFFLFQEVDYHSKRSYYKNQFEQTSGLLSGYSAAYAVNYLVDWVPLPVLEPWRAYGRMNAGLGSWSRFQPQGSVRHQLPGEYAWPDRIFQLDRCALVQHYPTSFGNDLVVINIHNSAYDKGGVLKAQQMAYLKTLFEEEYQKGNYVVVGGDWNQCPPGFQFDALMPGKTQGHTQTNIAEDFMGEGWQWIANTSIATNRKVKDLYQKGTTFETVIDFFLISPNVKFRSVKGLDQGFAFSDHQPVIMEVLLEK